MKIDILGVKVDQIRQKDVLTKIGEWILQKEGNHYIVTLNPEFVIWSQDDEEFKDILDKADLAISDGIGLLWTAKYLSLPLCKYRILRSIQAFWQMIYTGLNLIFSPKYCQTILPERITGVDLVWEIAKLCEQKICSIYLLGSYGDTALLAANRLKQKFPNLKIAGSFAGSPDKKADSKLCAIINHTKPDILLVAYGHPKQEKWIVRNLPKLTSVKVAMGVGGAFDFIAGKVKRAPLFLRKIGLEWLWRLIIQPWRIKRIFKAVVKFPMIVFRYKIKC